MRIEALREFIEFAKCQNITAAAKRLFISQPALSNHIANLEKELGVELVRRGSALVELTAAGKAFFEGCCEVLGTYDTVVDKVRNLAEQGENGSLVIKAAFGEGWSSIKMVELVQEFRRLNPAVSVKMLRDSRNTVTDDLAQGVVDCAQLFDCSLLYERMGIDLASVSFDCAPITVAARRGHPLMMRTSVRFDDILEYPYAMPVGDSFEECHLSVQQIYLQHGHELKNIHYKVVDSVTELAMELRGLEIMLAGPNPTLPGDLTFRPFEPQEYQDFCLVYRRDSDNPVLASFVEFIRERCL